MWRGPGGQGSPRNLEAPATGRILDAGGPGGVCGAEWLSEAPYLDQARAERFSLRGLAKVRGEWDLVCLAVNAKRLRAMAA